MSFSTIQQLHTFYAKDREIFSKLVLKFSRSPAESLLVMATWLWLEDFRFEHIFSVIIALSDPYIVALADEAVSCFQCLDYVELPNHFNEMPLTAGFMKKNISIKIIYQHRYSAITKIKNFLTTICSRIFSDILQRVLPSSSSSSRFRRPLNIPGFPHPTFGNIIVMPYDFIALDNLKNNNNLFTIPNGLWRWNSNCIATENDRTIFLTFSCGFPVSEKEVKNLFTYKYGENSVEGVYMGENNGKIPKKNMNINFYQQSLYARLVLDSVVTVDRILKGESVRKFEIYNKHIWARKYEDRRRSCFT